jgi:hypothetical protein
MLVGEIILGARELAPDLPGVLPKPAGVVLVAAAGGSLPSGTWYIRTTELNSYGETDATTEQSVVTASPGTRTINISLTTSGILGNKVRVYVGTSAGAEDRYLEFNVGDSISITSLSAAIAGVPPQINTAFLPDSSGGFCSAHQMYRWLNDGLSLAARITGGIRDMTGIKAVANQSMYEVTGQWVKFTDGWYDGYPIALGGKRNLYLRNRVTSQVLSCLIVAQHTNRTVLEFWPQPSNAAASTTLNGSITATATTATLTSVTGLLPSGLIKIDSEIIHYDWIDGMILKGLTRGLGGTLAASHNNAVVVDELNIRLDGLRIPDTYAVGDASKTLAVPAGWETLLVDYLLHRYRKAEQQTSEAQALLQQFEKDLRSWVISTKPPAGPRQVGDANALETMYGSSGGGIIIP